MGRNTRIGENSDTVRRVRNEAQEALESCDLSDVMEAIGSEQADVAAASTMLKTILAEKMTEYAVKAIGEARRRKTKLGAATILIAAQQ